MKYAVIKDGVVSNVIEANADFASSIGAVEATPQVEIGDSYDGAQFHKQEVPVHVPQEVTMRQARQALILAGLDDDVEAAINAIPGIQGKLARAEWDQSQTVQRNRPLVVQLGAALGLDLDQLFIAAANL